MKLTSYKTYAKKSTPKKLHDKWDNVDEICPLSNILTLGQLEIKAQNIKIYIWILLCKFKNCATYSLLFIIIICVFHKVFLFKDFTRKNFKIVIQFIFIYIIMKTLGQLNEQ